MTDEEIKLAYFEYMQDYCNNYDIDIEKLTGGIKLALNQLIEIDPMQFNISSEKLSDMSITYSNSEGGIPKHIINYLAPYKRVRSV